MHERLDNILKNISNEKDSIKNLKNLKLETNIDIHKFNFI